MIRWITQRLGTAPAGSPDIEPGFAVVDVRDLVDKFGNDPALVRQKIEQGLALLKDGGPVVVCCDYGISRSNSIAAGILSRHESIPFSDAVRKVRETTGEEEIKLEPLNVVRAALGEYRAASRSRDGLRALITGGSGFVGSALRTALDADATVFAPSRQEADLSAGAAALDLLVKEHDVSCLVHLANPRVYTSAKASGDCVTMMRNVLDVARENRLRLVYLSGWEVYSGYRATELIAAESLPILPNGPHGEAKMLCERLLQLSRDLFDLEAIVVRSSAAYGPAGDRPKFIHNFLSKARAEKEIRTHEYTNGPAYIDLLHIDDLVAALVKAVHSGVLGDFNIGSGRLVSTRTIAQYIVTKLKSKSNIMAIQIKAEGCSIRMDSAKAKTLLDWAPRRSLEDGLNGLLTKGLTDD